MALLIVIFFVYHSYCTLPAYCASRCVNVTGLWVNAKWSDPGGPDVMLEIYVVSDNDADKAVGTFINGGPPYGVDTVINDWTSHSINTCGFPLTGDLKLRLKVLDGNAASYNEKGHDFYDISNDFSLGFIEHYKVTSDYEIKAKSSVTCAVIPCGTRRADVEGCYLSDVDTDCFQKLNDAGTAHLTGGGSCTNSFDAGLYYVEGGKWKLKSCSDREADASRPFPCGETGCYQQLSPTSGEGELMTGTGSCQDSCNTGLTKVSLSDVKCELIDDCDSRMVNISYTYPCGESTGCYQQVGQLNCGTTCPEFTVTASDGTCTVIPCSDRVPTNGECRPPQGVLDPEPDCGYNPDSANPFSECMERCPENHTHSNARGVCELKECAQRLLNITAEFACGEPLCIIQYDGTSCTPNCPEFYRKNSDGKCEIIPCTERTTTSSQCLPSDGAPEDELNCGYYVETHAEDATLSFAGCAPCPSAHYTVSNGVCVLKGCADRVINETSLYPCGNGEPSCATLGDACVAEADCPADYSLAQGRCEPAKSQSNNPDSFPWWIFVIIGVVLVGAIAIIVIIIVKKRHKKKPVEEEGFNELEQTQAEEGKGKEENDFGVFGEDQILHPENMGGGGEFSEISIPPLTGFDSDAFQTAGCSKDDLSLALSISQHPGPAAPPPSRVVLDTASKGKTPSTANNINNTKVFRNKALVMVTEDNSTSVAESTVADEYGGAKSQQGVSAAPSLSQSEKNKKSQLASSPESPESGSGNGNGGKK